ncbi:MAG: MBL fold metallo-hydrolase [Candidatus Magasanikbacteria bacterium]|nr:MBL fold metallo-hydrolase [Candidatus Magasanikbacteria bacterium]
MRPINKAIFSLLTLLIAILAMIFYLHEGEIQTSADEGSEINSVGSTDEIKVTFLDIGQGDATFIEFPNGEQMLVDCAIDARIIEALGRVMPYYDHDIDYLLVTHPDTDHYAGCTEVLKRFDVKNIIYTGVQKEDDTWLEFWNTVEQEPADYYEINDEGVWEIASTTIHFLYPDHSLVEDSEIPGTEKEANGNNTSIVFKLSYGDMDLLMTGDAEEDLEEYLLAIYGDQLDVNILKAGHHGSGSSSMQDFIDMVGPDHTIISCGQNNKFGHPSRRVLKRLERAGSEIWRTDLLGDIIVYINRDSVFVNER